MEWIYERKSCCYVLRCANPECTLITTVRYVKGEMPTIGDRVKIDDGETMEKIGVKIK